jgi:2-polyprenyl-3-methyl-5-hydroxy-6-metoxy-1,4-benzoquinol methylase
MGAKFNETARPEPENRPMTSFRKNRIDHWNGIATAGRELSRGMRGFYHHLLSNQFRFLVPEGARVMEIGCAEGDLLASLKPSFGVGVDFSSSMLITARERYPHLSFIEADAHSLSPDYAPDMLAEPFEAIILSDLVNDIWDVQTLFQQLHQFCDQNTRIFLNFHSHLWEHPFRLLQRTKKVTRRLEQNWLTPDDVKNLLELTGFEVIRSFEAILFPLAVPGLEGLSNRWLVKFWPFSIFALTHFQICRALVPPEKPGLVSVVIPARNEAGNIENAMLRTPEMGAGTELIFVEGNSTDDTWQAITEAIAKHPERRCRALRQPGKGKGDAVRAGFAAAEGDILMILDADLTIPPETLPQFFEAIASNHGEFINGVRLVYPQEKQAMRFFNLVGNKFFSLAFSWLLGRPIKDSLCGTKVLSRANYMKIAANRTYFGDFDPFGDFDLLFGAAKQNLKIVDLPVRYRERTYGETNISRWRDGFILLRMVLFAMNRIKFMP